jgi:hypothetical protein
MIRFLDILNSGMAIPGKNYFGTLLPYRVSVVDAGHTVSGASDLT